MKWYFDKYQTICILCASIIVISIISLQTIFQVDAATGKCSLEWAIEPKIGRAFHDFSEGVCYYKSSPSGYINHSGNTVYEFEVNQYESSNFSNGYALITLRPSMQLIGYLERKTFDIITYQDIMEKYKKQYSDTNGQIDHLTNFSEGKALFHFSALNTSENNSTKSGYLDTNFHFYLSGENISKKKETFFSNDKETSLESEGLLSIKTKDGWGLVDEEGNEIIKPNYDEITYGEGLLTAFKDEKVYLYDTNGNLLVNLHKQYPKISNISISSENLIAAEIMQKDMNMEPAVGYFKNPLATPSEWAEKEILEAFTYSLIPETLAYNYQTPITKKEFAKLIMHLMQKIDFFEFDFLSSAPLDTFKDTIDYSVLKLVKAGIIKQTKNQIFEPEKPISKEEAQQILKNTIDYLNINTKIDEIIPQNDISKNYTREQAISIILNLYKKASS